MRRGLIGIALALVACKSGGGEGRAGGGAASGARDAGAAIAAVDAAGAAGAVGAVDAGDVAPVTVDAAPPTVDAGAGRAATPTPPGVVRLVLVHDVPLLRSEEKALQRVTSALARGKLKGTVVDAGDEEAALYAAWTARLPPEPLPPLPAAWADAPLVIVMRVDPPSGVEPKRQSSGLGPPVVFRPPSNDAVFVAGGSATGDSFDGLIAEGGLLSMLATFARSAP
ncbi:MAG: hypothetical protein IPH44_35650 [Myxococcales bacterium]|nr:hypothetical protein [Myxococcales bacterium]MBP6842432.1 hypothetical protein [Kofleriaceae bacterium]